MLFTRILEVALNHAVNFKSVASNLDKSIIKLQYGSILVSLQFIKQGVEE